MAEAARAHLQDEVAGVLAGPQHGEGVADLVVVRPGRRDRDAASQSFAKAIKALQTAKQNTRFFPKDEYDEAVHDTYYYTALAYHKLYLITRQPAVMNNASLAWREYFDFFPKKLENQPTFAQARDAARRYRDQIQEQ